MTVQMQVYRCNICGNIVQVMHAGVGQLVCCNQPMEPLTEKTKDVGLEKHVPVIEKTQKGILVKVILESGFLSSDQIAKACEISYEAGADFVKTSTGFGPGGAKPEYVEIMKKTVGGKMKIKPSGGIRDWETAVAFLEQGADRLGIGSTEAVLNGAKAEGNY